MSRLPTGQRPVVLSPATARKLSQIISDYDRGLLKHRTQRPSRTRPAAPILAKITGSASLATNRWKYAWTEVQIDGDSVTNRPNGRSGTTTTDYAINLAEMFHTVRYAWGVDMDGADYPDGAIAQPIGGGGATAAHRYDVVVWIWAITDTNGDRKFVFSAQGSHDGSCS